MKSVLNLLIKLNVIERSLGPDFDPNEIDQSGNTALTRALIEEDSDLVLSILTYDKLNLNLGKNPILHIACEKNWHRLIEIILFDQEIEVRPDLSVKNAAGFTAMEVAVQHNSTESIALLRKYEQQQKPSFTVTFPFQQALQQQVLAEQ